MYEKVQLNFIADVNVASHVLLDSLTRWEFTKMLRAITSFTLFKRNFKSQKASSSGVVFSGFSLLVLNGFQRF